ncbi:hypothetical protein H0E84_03370 [Luteimonas sp. SJ-92]|uniref:MvdD-like pre-ATP grasp domain-containing protein n=1 Tax=Luteimonas salinisoli TaxID=2752307 RepID=A0A853J8E9_9GAMM|nr:hypothetical protein [Luteimonas salinisoli]NZA25411.1 hypothetical protein [Luteimonas salinisoli]
MKRTLAITHSADLHVDLAEPVFRAEGGRLFRLNLDCFPRDYEFCQTFKSGILFNQMRHLPSGELIDLREVGSVWNRKPAKFSFLSENLTSQELAYAERESEQALFGLLYTLDCYWMSHPVALRGAMWKGEQLQRAARIGFRVPDSIITNSPRKARSFKNSIQGNMVFKSMSTPDLCAYDVESGDRVSDGVTTTVITDDMTSILGSVKELACQFQEYVDKHHELRITVIGDHVFAAMIHSQDDPRTTIDSRDMSAEIAYEPTILPPEIEARCLDLVRSYGLTYSAIDLIVTPDGEYVFLENNPAGQFLYVEQLVPEFKMLEAVVRTLLKEGA